MVDRLYRLFSKRGDMYGIARPLEQWTPRDPRHVAYRQLESPGAVTGEWPDVEFALEDGPAADCLSTVEGVALYSHRLREAIESALSPADDVQWLPASAPLHPGGRRVRWWLRHPVTGEELVDAAASVHAPTAMRQAPPGFSPIIKATFSAAALGDRQVAKYAYGYPPVVSARVRAAIEAARCTGVDFEGVPLS